MSRPTTRSSQGLSTNSADLPTPSSTLPQQTLQEMLDIMRRLEQRLEDTDKRLVLLETTPDPAPSSSGPILSLKLHLQLLMPPVHPDSSKKRAKIFTSVD
jgi:hypothetical protein